MKPAAAKKPSELDALIRKQEREPTVFTSPMQLDREAELKKLSELKLVSTKSVPAVPLPWLWHGRLARGIVSILTAKPSMGLSSAAIDLAARLSRGDAMPLQEEPKAKKPMGVVFLGQKDSIAGVVRPRLEAAGADIELVHHLLTKNTINLSFEEARIRDVIQASKAGLLIANLPGRKASDLSVLQDIAEKTACAILLVNRIDAKQKAAFLSNVPEASIGLLLTDDPDEGGSRLLSCLQSSYCEPVASLKFRIENKNGAGVVDWLGESDWDGQELAYRTEAPGTSGKLRECQELILALLAEGPMSSAVLEWKVTEQTNCSHSTFKRARSLLHVKTTKRNFAGEWSCELPKANLHKNGFNWGLDGTTEEAQTMRRGSAKRPKAKS